MRRRRRARPRAQNRRHVEPALVPMPALRAVAARRIATRMRMHQAGHPTPERAPERAGIAGRTRPCATCSSTSPSAGAAAIASSSAAGGVMAEASPPISLTTHNAGRSRRWQLARRAPQSAGDRADDDDHPRLSVLQPAPGLIGRQRALILELGAAEAQISRLGARGQGAHHRLEIGVERRDIGAHARQRRASRRSPRAHGEWRPSSRKHSRRRCPPGARGSRLRQTSLRICSKGRA